MRKLLHCPFSILKHTHSYLVVLALKAHQNWIGDYRGGHPVRRKLPVNSWEVRLCHRLCGGGSDGLPLHLGGFELGMGDEQMPNQSLK
jgi:hypothetical protein